MAATPGKQVQERKRTKIPKKKKNKEKKGEKLTLAAPPIQYFWADSHGVFMMNSPVLES